MFDNWCCPTQDTEHTECQLTSCECTLTFIITAKCFLVWKKQKKKCSINSEFGPNLVKADLKFTFDIIRPIGSTELLEVFSSEKCFYQCNCTYLARGNVIPNSGLSSSSAGLAPLVCVGQRESRFTWAGMCFTRQSSSVYLFNQGDIGALTAWQGTWSRSWANSLLRMTKKCFFDHILVFRVLTVLFSVCGNC